MGPEVKEKAVTKQPLKSVRCLNMQMIPSAGDNSWDTQVPLRAPVQVEDRCQGGLNPIRRWRAEKLTVNSKDKSGHQCMQSNKTVKKGAEEEESSNSRSMLNFLMRSYQGPARGKEN